MFTKEQEKKVLEMINSQTKYKTKEELLLAVRNYFTNNQGKDKKEVRGR